MPNVKSFLSKAYSLSLNRQFVFFAGIGLMLVLMVFSINWVRTPDYTPLFSSLSSHDEKNVVKLLDANDIHYKLSPSSGMILVSGAKVNKARMLMAQNGLPSTTQDSYSLLMKNEGIYTSQTNEDLIKTRILEENIQSAIETINGVEAAKVQLALPHHTDFMQQIIHPKASIVLRLAPGVVLTSEQVQGITYLVSSSIPYLKPSEVTVVDQTGALLSGTEVGPFALSSNQLKYKEEVEGKLEQQIMNVLIPIVGRDNVHVQVNANLDFNARENTTKAYMPSKKNVESEQIEKSNQQNAGQTAQGVPGSLTNQPPKSGKLDEQRSGGSGGGAGGANNTLSSNDRETYNFSLGESITHTDFSKGQIQNLSVAIVLNDKKVLVTPSVKTDAKEKGKEKKEKEKEALPETKYEAWKPEEIAKLTALAKDAIGFNENRGDRISVVSEHFVTEPVGTIKAFSPPIYQQTWFLEMVKGFLFLGGFAIFALYIWRPFYNKLFAPSEPALVTGYSDEMANEGPAAVISESVQAQAKAATQGELESTLSEVRGIFQKSPDVAAGVIKRWVRSDA